MIRAFSLKVRKVIRLSGELGSLRTSTTRVICVTSTCKMSSCEIKSRYLVVSSIASWISSLASMLKCALSRQQRSEIRFD